MNKIEQVFEVVKQIPEGRVMTYGQIAKIVSTGPRVVGNILHQNQDPVRIPCHRVVSADGSCAIGYAFGGIDTQLSRLQLEGVVFLGKKVDLTRSLYLFLI